MHTELHISILDIQERIIQALLVFGPCTNIILVVFANIIPLCMNACIPRIHQISMLHLLKNMVITSYICTLCILTPKLPLIWYDLQSNRARRVVVAAVCARRCMTIVDLVFKIR